MDSVHAVDNVAIVDKVDRTSWAQSSIGKVCNVNKEDKEEKVLLLSAKHVFVSNNTVFGERQAPS